ncbi:MAG: glycosyltransferase [bacterium]|nr:glycosyltransferase [bacterium]
MKILQVIPYFVPAFSYGGPIQTCLVISQHMVNNGHEVTVATTDTLDGKERIYFLNEDIDGIRVVRFRNVSNSIAKKTNLFLPIGFRKWCKDNIKQFDIIHCHDFFTYQNIVVRYYAKKYHIPFIIQPHGSLEDVRLQARFGFIKRFFIRKVLFLLLEAKYVIALTKAEQLTINKIDSNANVSIVPNGINLDQYYDVQEINLHAKYNLPADTKLICFLGRVQYIKGLDHSLLTLKHLVGKVAFHFFIIGPNEGDEQQRLENIIKEDNLEKFVTFVGLLSGMEKKQFIKSCDSFLMLSRSEGLPISILEAAAVGLPTMISYECHVPELAVLNAGYEVDKIDYVNNAKILKNFFDSSDISDNMRMQARAVVADKFSVPKMVTKIKSLYQD